MIKYIIVFLNHIVVSVFGQEMHSLSATTGYHTSPGVGIQYAMEQKGVSFQVNTMIGYELYGQTHK
jgi:hypothetical protein